MAAAIEGSQLSGLLVTFGIMGIVYGVIVRLLWLRRRTRSGFWGAYAGALSLVGTLAICAGVFLLLAGVIPSFTD